MKPNYYRDIWICGPPNNGYPGAFPQGFIEQVKRKWWGKKRLWVFSGVFQDPDGTTVDLNPEVRPSHVGSAEELPFPNDTFDFVFADPPYSEEEAARLYGLPYPSMHRVLSEMKRVTVPGGHILLLHRLIPSGGSEVSDLEWEAIVGVGILAFWSNIRALCVWRKPNRIDDFAIPHDPPETTPNPAARKEVK